ncbi:hypothetical protein [Fusibacillus kribbianus]|uniref:Zn-finger containing protein n=1 Tax=Fusibacillus kribbianus TaxID=3044208 RepID=A0AAP4BA92_9FIRM|nr:hypothetical protein [Ruminococcus sp. YH-rum2234]MDI9242896.1 hypothetical protein [Ruminococcus sp. YH-rum2234]
MINGKQRGENAMSGFRDKMTRFMYGRYGTDQLNKCIMVITMVLLVFSLFIRYQIFYWLAVVGIVIMYFRMLSKNIYKRAAENTRFLNATTGIRKSVSRMKNRSRDKEHCYFKCPSCSQTVRVPRGKGKISITCPKCRTEFVKKT